MLAQMRRPVVSAAPVVDAAPARRGAVRRPAGAPHTDGGSAGVVPQVEETAAAPGSLSNQGVGILQREAAPGAGGEPSRVPPVVGEVLRSGGRSLDPAVRAHFEPRFGRDLGDVRVHTSAQADASARAVNARAFTVGRDIAFAAGEYAPDAAAGQRLLAHELAHVVQQGGQRSAPQAKLAMSTPGDAGAPEGRSSSARGNRRRLPRRRRWT
jgi:hypothetical protein